MDDIIIKSRKSLDNFAHLKKFFDRLCHYNLKLTPAKCGFRVPAGKLLGFIVSKRGIVLDPSKIKKAIKAQDLADNLVKNPVDKEYEPLKTYFHRDEVSFVGEDISEAYLGWRLFFDGATNHQGKGIGAVLVSKTELKKHPFHYSHVEAKPDGLPWYFYIKKYLEFGTYLEDATSIQKKSICRMDLNFFLSGEVLYRRTPDLGLLRFVDVVEAAKLIGQIHAGVCAWGMDVIGMVDLAASNGHRFILVAIDYFTNWVEEASYKSVTKKVVVDFVCNNQICRLRKMIDKHRGWHEMLPYALLGYRTTVRTSTGATPYLLVYGTQAVIPAEVEIPSLRIIQEAELSND
ncbi:uncharacterized protein [Solanum lycopersicum]|uniref:uncharacterized protein n=1 Tax=Solanum lycopersicum TaxID=4081 RepID=UPI0037479C22